jgi:hypothetical protein
MGPSKTNRAESAELAASIFAEFGIGKEQKLSKQQFIEGYF